MDGYKTIKDLSSYNNWTQSYRYKTLQLEKDGKFYLYKKANDDHTKKLLQNEVRFRQFFQNVIIDNIECTKISEFGDDYLIFEWIEQAKELATRSPEAMPSFEQHIDRFVDLLVAMDKAGVDYKPKTDDTDAIHNMSVCGQKLVIEERIQEVLDEKWIDSDRISKAIEIHEKYLDKEVAQYQHGDFTPWHIFVNDDQWLVYDAEHANSQRTRYSDLAHSYLRVAIHCEAPQLASRILARFIDKSKVDSVVFKNQITSLFVGRAVGNVIDSYNDRETADYREQAIKVLDAVLEDNLSALTNIS